MLKQLLFAFTISTIINPSIHAQNTYKIEHLGDNQVHNGTFISQPSDKANSLSYEGKVIKPSKYDKSTTLILSIFLGHFGIDRFYVGKYVTGALKLACSIFSFGIVGSIWWIIDIVKIIQNKFTDHKGHFVINN